MFHEDHRLRIVTHPLCPHGQRMRLVLLRKGLLQGSDFVMTYIDLAAQPDWFRELSPEGRMPVLTVDDDALFDQDAACELLDEVTPGRLFPKDPIARARQRVAARQASRSLDALKTIFTAKDRATVTDGCAVLFDSLAPLESRLERAPATGRQRFFDGVRFGHVDAAYAPVFCLALFFPWLRDHAGWQALPEVRAWGETLAHSNDVLESRCPDYRGEFTHFFEIFGSHFAKLGPEHVADAVSSARRDAGGVVADASV